MFDYSPPLPSFSPSYGISTLKNGQGAPYRRDVPSQGLEIAIDLGCVQLSKLSLDGTIHDHLITESPRKDVLP